MRRPAGQIPCPVPRHFARAALWRGGRSHCAACWQLFPSHSHAFTHRHSQSGRLFAHSTAGSPRPQRWWEPAPNSSSNDKVVAAAAGSECGWRHGGGGHCRCPSTASRSVTRRCCLLNMLLTRSHGGPPICPAMRSHCRCCSLLPARPVQRLHQHLRPVLDVSCEWRHCRAGTVPHHI